VRRVVVFLLERGEESKCVELGGEVQAANRKGLSTFRDSHAFQRAQQASESAAKITTPTSDHNGVPSRESYEGAVVQRGGFSLAFFK